MIIDTINYREAQFRLQVLDGTNYPFWKTLIRFYLKSIREKIWRQVVIRSEPPKKNGELKSETDWILEEEIRSETNSCAMNAIGGVVNEQVHTLIAQCDIAKDAWDILATT